MSTTRAEPGAVELIALGERVRRQRARRGMTRKMLAQQSGVSERFLAQLESGEGNASFRVLSAISQALDLPVASIVSDAPEQSVELEHTTEILRQLGRDDLARAHRLLLQNFSWVTPNQRFARIALVGLRGAGKSTIGPMLAQSSNRPFLELDRLIEHASGYSMGAVLELHGQSGLRRLERRSLNEVLDRYPRFVLATGGSLVSELSTYDHLLKHCYTVWLRATPEDHMQRVIAQGDLRPMADNSEAMSDLERILRERSSLYARADLTVDTSKHSAAEAADQILAAINNNMNEVALKCPR